MKTSKGFTLIEAVIAVGMVLSLLVVGAAAVNWVFGIAFGYKSRAEASAEEYLTTVRVPHGPPQCMKRDSDNDGYISCSYESEGRIMAIECAYMLDDGCRLPKAVGWAGHNAQGERR